jgi:hypothetical protein
MKRDVRRSSHLQVAYLLYIAIAPNTVIAFLGDTYGTSSREGDRHTRSRQYQGLKVHCNLNLYLLSPQYRIDNSRLTTW